MSHDAVSQQVNAWSTSPKDSDELKAKWQAMTAEAYRKLVLSQDMSEDKAISALNMIVPPAIAGIPMAMAFAALTFYSAGIEKEAMEWADKLMRLDPDDEDAEVMLAKASVYGEGIGKYEKDIELYLDLCRKAADKGNLDAACLLAEMYYEGGDVEQDYKAALLLAKDAYKAGNAFGLYIYGRAYYEGNGLHRDRVTGRRLIREAASMKDNVNFMGIICAGIYIIENNI